MVAAVGSGMNVWLLLEWWPSPRKHNSTV